MADTGPSWANIILNYDLTNILMKLMECIACYILPDLIMLIKT